MFDLVKKLNQDYCFRCGVKIDKIEEFSIEHKENWLDSEDPKKLFYDLNNISFSHLFCNTRARRSRIAQHGSVRRYLDGCRCELCKEANNIKIRKYRNRKKFLSYNG